MKIDRLETLRRENEMRRDIMIDLEVEILEHYDGPEDKYNTRLLTILRGPSQALGLRLLERRKAEIEVSDEAPATSRDPRGENK